MTLAWLFLADLPPDETDSPRSHDTVGYTRRVHATMPTSDVATVTAIRAGDATAFEQLYRHHYAPMVAFATPYVHDVDAARELVSDIFLTLWLRRREWIVQTSVATYLYQALRHRAANARRDAGVDARHIAHATAAGVPIGAGQSATPPDDAAMQRERAERLWRAVDALPEPRRMIVRLRWREGMSFDEIAAVVGTSSAAVQMQLSRALKALRGALAEL